MHRMLTYTLKYHYFTDLTDFFHSVAILIKQLTKAIVRGNGSETFAILKA